LIEAMLMMLPALPPPDQRVRKGLGEEEGSGQVQTDHCPPILRGGVERWATADRACVVDENVGCGKGDEAPGDQVARGLGAEIR
jgi:hypothetical protein